MRVILLADVHANWEALLTLQRAEPKPDAVLFAGDAVGYGPDAVNCARWLLANTAAARGNHDDGVGRRAVVNTPPELEEAARETIDYSRALMSREDINGIAAWPLSVTLALNGATFYVTHGSPIDPLGGQVNAATCAEAELHSLFDNITADVIVLGHTHLPAIRRFDGRLIVNPGSLGQPRYGVPDATYAVWEDGNVQIKHLHYDHEATVQKLRLAPLSAETRDQLVEVLETGLVPVPEWGFL